MFMEFGFSVCLAERERARERERERECMLVYGIDGEELEA